MSSLRQQVVAAARGWIGTPYHAHARVRGVGVDCIHLLCAVFEEVGLISPLDPGMYPISWAVHRSQELYMAGLDARACRTDYPHAGDVALFKYGRTFSHAGIVTGDGRLVHSLARLGVIETPIDGAPLAGRPVIFYDLYSIRN